MIHCLKNTMPSFTLSFFFLHISCKLEHLHFSPLELICLVLKGAHAQELHSCGNSHIKPCLVYGGGQYNSNENIKSMQNYAKVCKICENMWKYVKVCKLNGYLASLPKSHFASQNPVFYELCLCVSLHGPGSYIVVLLREHTLLWAHLLPARH